MIEKPGSLTEDEAHLYDRQIRLWGLDAQKRLRSAQVLLIGIGGLGAEVAKNITLAGVKSLTMLDSSKVKSSDLACNFFLDSDSIGNYRSEASYYGVQQLNPMVSVQSDIADISERDEEYLKHFDVICATSCDSKTLQRLDSFARSCGIAFFAGDVRGYYGYCFLDLGKHSYAEEVKEQNTGETMPASVENGTGEPAAKKRKIADETVTIKSEMNYVSYKDAVEIDWSKPEFQSVLKKTPSTYFIILTLQEFFDQFQRSPSCSQADHENLQKSREIVAEKYHVNIDAIPEEIYQYCVGELSPVCAIVGGVLGQEIIKAVSKKDQPHNNFFFYNGVDGSGMVDHIGATSS